MGRGARNNQAASNALDALLDEPAYLQPPRWLSGLPAADDRLGWLHYLSRSSQRGSDTALRLLETASDNPVATWVTAEQAYNAVGAVACGCGGVLFADPEGNAPHSQLRVCGEDDHIQMQLLYCSDNPQALVARAEVEGEDVDDEHLRWAQAGLRPRRATAAPLNLEQGTHGLSALRSRSTNSGLVVTRDIGSECVFRYISPTDALHVAQAMRLGVYRAWVSIQDEEFALTRRDDGGLTFSGTWYGGNTAKQAAIFDADQVQRLYEHVDAAPALV